MGFAITIDGKDREILEVLRKDGRSSLREIGDKVDLSPSSVRSRIIRLIDANIIQRFTVELDHRKIGLEIQVLLIMTCKPGAADYIYKALSECNEITDLFRTAGPANLACIVRTESMEHLTAFMQERIERLEDIDKLETLFLLPTNQE